MAYSSIQYEVRESVAIVTLDRPAKLNAITDRMVEEIGDAMRVSAEDRAVRVVIVRGAGRAFSSGADLMGADSKPGVSRIERDGLDHMQWFLEHSRDGWDTHVWRHPKPVIAQVHGYCLGMALDLVNACDLIVASDDARFGLPEARFGGILIAYLPWLIGPRRTKELLFTGKQITAQEALQMGMVNEVVPLTDLERRTAELAGTIARIPEETTYFGKLAINRACEVGGLESGLFMSWALNSLSKLTKGSIHEWDRIRKEQGLKAALAWRDRPFEVGRER